MTAPILEIALLQVVPGQDDAFELAFAEAQSIISSMEGYLGHELRRCLERPHTYALLVRWRSLEDHTVGFRQSPEYERWKAMLHHFYDPFPTVEHFTSVYSGGTA